jgi:hypothetical protein
MGMEADRYFNAPRGMALLWVAVLAGPIAWFLQQQVGYGMATFACGRGGEVGLHVVTGVAIDHGGRCHHRLAQLGAVGS